MKPLGAPKDGQERLAEAALSSVPFLDARALRYEPALSGAASPSYQGVESTLYRVTQAEGEQPSLFLKVHQAECAELFDPARTFGAGKALAQLGLTPEPLHLAADQGAILFRLLGPEWRPATLDALGEEACLSTVVATLRTIAEGPPMGKRWTVFDGIADMRERLGPEADTLPDDAWWLFDGIAAIAEALAAAGADSRPAHGDPHATNIMLGPDGAVRLVDLDMACDTDPHYQLAALLNEACQFDSEMRAGLEMWNGAWSEALYNRCLAYAAADDLYWGLRALLFDRLSPRTSLEFRKYAAWRLLRCRMRINRPGFEETLRRLG
ncbi:phosphotransferase [Aureimonas altamirensis]|uniref:phosphotransferase n=1 Tax=Aureimonas altamirensis TaxID=370622 RepID=UPI00255259A3|nr:phosphotransferase [Aureimonas altamirensis]